MREAVPGQAELLGRFHQGEHTAGEISALEAQRGGAHGEGDRHRHELVMLRGGSPLVHGAASPAVSQFQADTRAGLLTQVPTSHSLGGRNPRENGEPPFNTVMTGGQPWERRSCA